MMNKFKKRTLMFIFFTFFFISCISAQEQLSLMAQAKPAQELISLNLKDVNIKDALKIITEASGYNIVVDKDVNATVNIILTDVTWQTALENILKTNGLTYMVQENIIRITTLDTVKREEDKLPLVTKIITLNFAKATTIQGSLSTMLSGRGSIQINTPTNALIITDTPEAVSKITMIAENLDIRTPQVMIEALIMSVKLTDSDQFGIDWIATYKNNAERSITQSLKASASILDLAYGKTILPQWNFSEQIAIYAQDKKVTILANPRVLTLDNTAANIEINEQVPYSYVAKSTDGGRVSETQFKEVGIKLFVTPHITKDKFISLDVKAEQSFVASFVGDTNQPAVDSRKAQTNFMLRDGETAVIGGLRKKEKTITIDKIPLLGDLPLLGKLFRKENSEITDTELIIFITPRIVENAYMTEMEREKQQNAKNNLNRDKAILDTLSKMSNDDD